jgi:ERCC4-type nuclease|uniref:ERCC4 domain-containing protein n=1 Tax=viral metagenome TaxID=1070528 RepID=A0A6C0JNH5_9ZZZZ
MLKLIIDSREKQLFNSIKERDLDNYNDFIEIESTNLELGDIKIILSDDFELIFERKTLTDLNQSINDGRYKEQKNRLLSNYNSNLITYIIEGDDILKSINRNDKRISSVYLHSLYRDNIKILFTKNIFETTNLILTLCTKIIDKPNDFTNTKKETDYTDIVKIKSKKISNITPDNCFILQLCQIPNISSTIAKNIVSKYSNIKELLTSLDNCDCYENKIKLLQEIDKVGKDKAKKIIDYMKL